MLIVLRFAGQTRAIHVRDKKNSSKYLHDRLQLDVAVRALPARHQVQHVDAGHRLAVVDALLARQLHAQARKQREPRGLVAHPEQPGVEVVPRGQRGDRQQARVPDEQEGRDRLLFFFWVVLKLARRWNSQEKNARKRSPGPRTPPPRAR
jgi:hypothetical protein